MSLPFTLKRTALLMGLASGLLIGGCAANQNSDAPSVSKNSSKAPAVQGQEKIFSLPYTMKELDNGLRVVVVKTDYPDLVSLHIPVQTGSRNEVEQGKSGFAHFFEHMMFKGTPTVPGDEFGRILKNAGADNNAYTSDDLTNYYTTFPKEYLETMIKLEADRFQNLSYEEAEFRTEALAVKGEYLKNFSNPIRKLLAALRFEAYEVHPYKHTTMGYLEDIEQMPDQMDYAKEFFKRWYSPQFTTVIVVGDVNPDKTLQLVEQYWGDWQASNVTVEIPEEPEQTAPKYKHQQEEGVPQTHMLIGFHGPELDEDAKDKPALDLLDQVYFSQTSDLYQDLVVQRQLVDQFFTWFPNRKDESQLMILARLKDPKNTQEVYDAITRTLVRARTELVDEKRLEDIKSNMKYSFANAMDSTPSIASTLSTFTHFERDPELLNRLYRTFEKVTAKDIKQAANTYFVDNKRTTITMSPTAELANFDPAMQLDQKAKQANKGEQRVAFEIVDLSNQSDLIDLSFLFHAGAVDDPKGKKGITALMAMMMADGGTASRSYKDIQNAMFPIAGAFGVQMDKEMLVFRGRVHRDNLDSWYDIASEQILAPGWREEDFSRVKDNLISAIETGLKASNDEELGKEVLYEELYQGHPYGSLNNGHIDDIKSLTLDDLKQHYNDIITQKRLTIGMTGKVPPSFKQTLKKDFAQLPVSGKPMVDIPEAPALKGRHATIVSKPSTTSTAVSFGFPIDVKRGDKDWVALWLVRSWLGEHRNSNSHLYQRIRQARGMNYGDYAYIEYYPRGMYQQQPDANLGRSEQIFQVWLRPLRSNNDAHFATRVAMFELEKLIKNGLNQEQFESTRNFLRNNVAQLVAQQSRQLGYALDSRYYDIPEFVEYVRSDLEKLTKEDVNRVLRKHLQLNNIQFVFISPDAQDMKQRLVKGSESPMTYNSDKDAELLQEDKVIARYPLNIPDKNIEVVPLENVFN